jgi:hypothetical protein
VQIVSRREGCEVVYIIVTHQTPELVLSGEDSSATRTG